MILLILLLVIPSFSFAQTDACNMLRDVLNSSEPMITQAMQLKEQCENETKNGTNTKLKQLLDKLVLQDELSSAHQARFERRLQTFVEFKSIVDLFKKDLLNLKKQKDRRTPAILYLRTVPLLNEKFNFFVSNQKQQLNDFYSNNFSKILSEIRNVTKSSTNNDHQSFQKELDQEIESFTASSNAHVDKLNNLMIAEMRKVISFFESKKTDLISKAVDEGMDSFVNEMSPLVDRIEVTVFWNKYLAKSKLMHRLDSAERNVALGMFQTAIDDYQEIKRDITSFLSRVPKKYRAALISEEAGFELGRIEKKILKLESYPSSKAAILLKESMKISVDEIENKKRKCFEKLPALAPIYIEHKDKFQYFLKSNLDSLNDKDRRLSLKLSEGTQAQFDVIRSACAKVKL